MAPSRVPREVFDDQDALVRRQQEKLGRFRSAVGLDVRACSRKLRQACSTIKAASNSMAWHVLLLDITHTKASREDYVDDCLAGICSGCTRGRSGASDGDKCSERAAQQTQQEVFSGRDMAETSRELVTCGAVAVR